MYDRFEREVSIPGVTKLDFGKPWDLHCFGCLYAVSFTVDQLREVCIPAFQS
jgi:hypothetical protein